MSANVVRFSAVLLLPQGLERSWFMQVGSMDLLVAVATGILAGAHTSTWGMYKDSPHEGFTWRKYARSILVAVAVALAWEAMLQLDLGAAGARLLLFGLTYVSERGLVEVYKTCLREEDQSKYFIPMQLHVMGRVVKSRLARWSAAAGFVAVVLACGWGLHILQGRADLLAPSLALILAGSLGGWLSAFGGAFKDAPIEGFETFKFFRSPAIAYLWSLVVAGFTHDYLLIALCSLGFTVATIETYKTFFFPNRPRGKWAGRPIRFADQLQWRYRFAPLFVAIWIVVIGHLATAVEFPGPGH